MFKQWRTLVSKELRQNLYALSGVIFILLFLIVCGCLLWLVPGSYNIPDSGYASLATFFSLAPVLLLILIPALSMRSLAEEKRMQTWVLLRSRPVSLEAIVSAKITAIFITVSVALLPTLMYVGCVYFYGQPVGNLDWGATAASYIGLLVLAMVFICLSVFASSLTSNQVIALILGLLLCVCFYYGWDLVGWEAVGFRSHYQSVQRGLIETRDLAYFLLISIGMFYLTLLGAGSFEAVFRRKKRSKRAFAFPAVGILIILAGLIFNFRFDWTQDRRYTLRPETKELLKTLHTSPEIELYLTGPLNPGFARLQQSALHLLDDFDRLSPQKIRYRLVDPYRQGRDFIDTLHQHRMSGISVNERSDDGRWTKQLVYPYALVKYGHRQMPVSLLAHPMGHSGEENLNLSGELLEYRFARALQLVMQTTLRIVFLEGHGEFPEAAVGEITDRLSHAYTIDRGILSGRPTELNDYDAVIIAGPQTSFSETDKWVLDQYLMQGGSLLWMVNGARIHSYEELVRNGETLAISNDLNLHDLFFTYGLRIEPVLLQDAQCLEIPVAKVDSDRQTEYVAQPWSYFPLLTPDPQSALTKDLSPVKAGFSSAIAFVGNHPQIKKETLLTTSSYAHRVSLPVAIRLEEADRMPEKAYFNESHVPVAVLLEGIFPSAFRNRSAFAAADHPDALYESRPAKMIVVASDEIITDPLGYDRYAQIRFANEDFILNAVNFLTDTAGISSLKNKSLHLQLLNKQALRHHRKEVIAMNCIAPPLLFLLIFGVLSRIRKGKIY